MNIHYVILWQILDISISYKGMTRNYIIKNIMKDITSLMNVIKLMMDIVTL